MSTNEEYRKTSMSQLASHFDDLASGASQVPSQPVESHLRDALADRRFLAFHDLLTAKVGPLFSHFAASVPYILEELCRIGVTLDRLTRQRFEKQRRTYTFYEIDAFDGSTGRTIATFSGGRIHTLANSPNIGNAVYFEKFANPEVSAFHAGPFLEVTPGLIAKRADLGTFVAGFDYLYETAAFQFYGTDRDAQITHVKRVLKPNGLAFFLEKLNHPDHTEFTRREWVKDNLFKTLYFTPEEIAWKQEHMLQSMHEGLVDFTDIVAALRRHFTYVYLIWNSTNFYEFVASDDRDLVESFVTEAGSAVIADDHCFERPLPRLVSSACPA